MVLQDEQVQRHIHTHPLSHSHTHTYTHSFYAGIRVGDVVLVFATTKITGKGNYGRVMYVYVVEEQWPVVWYLNQEQYARRFDSTYDTSTTRWTRNSNGGPWHRGDSNDTRQKNGTNDYERDQTRQTVLVSRQYRDFSSAPVPLPAHLAHLTHKSVGYCKQTRDTDVADVIAHFSL